MKNKLKLFEEHTIRTHWDESQEKWYFSVQDIVEVLSQSKDIKQYIKKMKSRDKQLNLNWGTICTLVPMMAKDGRVRKIQASDTKGILRIIQSISSPKAESFKQWLAQVGADRIDETDNPEKSIDRAMEDYLNLGYSKDCINKI